MNIKIQGGGGGVYANSGSCHGTANYLEHEEKERMQQGQEREHFFTHEGRQVPKSEVVNKIDNNKAQLKTKDAKYFVITVSPSKKELAKMGNTPEEQSKAMKEYINEKVIPQYAQNFNKGLESKDILYYAKVHHERGKGKGEGNLHAHIIVSRKTIDNKMQISPNTNHRNTSKGAVKGGFNRSDFFENCEKSFDAKFSYTRDLKEKYYYSNTMKNGTERGKALMKDIEQQQRQMQQYTQPKEHNQQQENKAEVRTEVKQEQQQQQQQSQSRGRGR